MRYMIFLPLLLLLFTSCEKNSCFQSSGEMSSRVIDIGEVSELKIYDFIDVHVFQSNEFRLEVFGGSNLINHVAIEQKEKQLIVRHNLSCRWWRENGNRIRVEIHLPELRKVEFLGLGDFYALAFQLKEFTFSSLRSAKDIHLEINADSLEFFLEQGSPDLYLSGSTEKLYIYHFGSGFVYARDLIADNIHLHHRSTGDFHVFPLSELFVEIYGTGNVLFYNEPEKIGGPITGKGKLIPTFE